MGYFKRCVIEDADFAVIPEPCLGDMPRDPRILEMYIAAEGEEESRKYMEIYLHGNP